MKINMIIFLTSSKEQNKRNECYVSLHPLAMEIEEINVNDYIDKLVANEWRVVSKEELITC
ncbi:hypothetical protein [Bacillus thermotolerans]|uniref:hypothetical protein n=1 Tax=Bacillus thermotolerans TaxID=1221996 RepID=UPI000588FE79|nr:hypothetical protein [Bacillus thermotolerans]KKB33681.1 hypothetical protein QY96_00414 [Bacillus thermotolerans]